MTQLRHFTLFLAGLVVLLVGSPAKAAPRTYQVSIETVPPGATVYLDDKAKGPIGYTPHKPKIAEGTHTLIIELEGYETQRNTLIIDKTAYKKTFSYTMVKSVKLPTIEVRAKSGDASADGAEVFVDGSSWGNVPVSKQTALGRHLVEVKKLDFSTYSEWVDVKEGETRTISASLEAVKKDATLKVEGTAGAQVLIDGILKGNIPTVISGVSPGRHFIEVKKESFESLGQWTEFRNGATETINATLTPAAPKVQFGTIKVFGEQDPADVYLDGDLQGKSPILLDKIPPGDHFVSVKKEGYKPFEQQLKVENNQNLVLKIALISSGPKTGTIRIISPQTESQVYIDGNLIGPVPVDKTDLSKGDHFIVVKKPGYRDWEKKITIDDKTPAMELVAELVATGNVKLLTNLEGADVFIDGEKRQEKSPAEGSPLELKDLPVGTHSIMVRLKDYQEFTSTISLAAGETKLVQVTLVKLGPSVAELLFRRKTISTYSARVLYPGNLAVDIMAGIPYYTEVHFTTGLQRSADPNEQFLPIDIGVDLKIAGSINEIYARGKYQLIATPVFGVGVEASAGVGLGLAKTADGTNFSANSFNLLGTGIASLFFRDILTVSARVGLHVYTDGSKGEQFVAEQTKKLDDGRDNGARLMLGLATQIHKDNRLSYNIALNGNPGAIGDKTGRTMYDIALPFNDPLLYLQLGVTLKF
jgi:PEGA domain